MDAQRNNKSAEALKKQIINNYAKDGHKLSDETLDKEVEYTQRLMKIQKTLTKEKEQQLLQGQKELSLVSERIRGIKEYKKIAQDLYEGGRNMEHDPTQIDGLDEY